jgi:hypothetical protein
VVLAISSDTASYIAPSPATVAIKLNEAVNQMLSAASAGDSAQGAQQFSAIPARSLLARTRSIVIPSGLADLARTQATFNGPQQATQDISFSDVCRGRLRREECLDCCTYKCEVGGGPPTASAVILHPVPRTTPTLPPFPSPSPILSVPFLPPQFPLAVFFNVYMRARI